MTRYVQRDTATAWKSHAQLLQEKKRLFSATDLQQFILQRRGSFSDTISTAGGVHYLLEYLKHLGQAEKTFTGDIRLAVRSLWGILHSLQPTKRDIPVNDIDNSQEWQEFANEMREIGVEVDVRGKGSCDVRIGGEGVERGERNRNIARGIRSALQFLLRSS